MRFFFITIALLSGIQAFGQIPDTLTVPKTDTISPPSFFPAERDSIFKDLETNNDTLPAAKNDGFMERVFYRGYPNPRVAALFSAVVPGAGQAYNKKWWKIPIVWGALGGIAYGTFSTRKTYHELRDAYKIIANGGIPEAPYGDFDAPRLKSYRDTFRGYTEKWFIALGVTYLLQVTDAFVDAHLTKFDVSEDLSLRLKPAFETTAGLPVFGLGISLSFSSPPVKGPLSFTSTRP